MIQESKTPPHARLPLSHHTDVCSSLRSVPGGCTAAHSWHPDDLWKHSGRHAQSLPWLPDSLSQSSAMEGLPEGVLVPLASSL